jgi:hypothetical protein
MAHTDKAQAQGRNGEKFTACVRDKEMRLKNVTKEGGMKNRWKPGRKE